MLAHRNESEGSGVRPAPADAPVQMVVREAPQLLASKPDWERERCGWSEWLPARQLMVALRRYQALAGRHGWFSRAHRKWLVARHRFWSTVAGADIPLNCSLLGGGLLMPHPQGIVIHPESRIGANCLLMQQVTIGTGSRPGLPRIGDNVSIYAGAKVLGGISIGNGAVVGANAVVLNDVPENALAVGVPAVIKTRSR